jgi:NAD(P)-dependent dehydrogenase (short-subunit alcohol dehydrogenase family)
MNALSGRTALVTGAGSGIGQAIAEALAAAGARVVVAELRPETGQETVDRIRSAGRLAEFVQLDVAAEPDFERAVSAFPEVDILVCNAGIGHVGTILTTSGADFDRMMSVNVRGVFNTMKAWIPGMVARGRGSVVNLASTAGLGGLVDRLAYSVSKHAVVGLTRSTALDLARTGVRVNCLCPGRVETPFVRSRIAEYSDPAAAAREMASTQAMGRLAQPSEVAAAAVFLASDASSFVTGVALPVDGGWTAGMFPKG